MHWRRLRPCPSPCNPAYEIGHCEGAPDHTVPYGTVLSKDAFPGTSCQATIAVSLRDARAAISQQPLASAGSGFDLFWIACREILSERRLRSLKVPAIWEPQSVSRPGNIRSSVSSQKVSRTKRLPLT